MNDTGTNAMCYEMFVGRIKISVAMYEAVAILLYEFHEKKPSWKFCTSRQIFQKHLHLTIFIFCTWLI